MAASKKTQSGNIRKYLFIGALVLFLPVFLFAVKKPTGLPNFASDDGTHFVLDATHNNNFLDITLKRVDASGGLYPLEADAQIYVAEVLPLGRNQKQDNWRFYGTINGGKQTIATNAFWSLFPGRYWVMANIVKAGKTCTPNPTYSSDEELAQKGLIPCGKDDVLVRTQSVDYYVGAVIYPATGDSYNKIGDDYVVSTKVANPLEVVAKSHMVRNLDRSDAIRETKIYYAPVSSTQQDNWTEVPVRAEEVRGNFTWGPNSNTGIELVTSKSFRGIITFPAPGRYWVIANAWNAYGMACTGNPSYTHTELQAKRFYFCGEKSYFIADVQ